MDKSSLLLCCIAFLHQRIDVFLLGGQSQVLKRGIRRVLGRHKGDGVLILEQRGELGVGFVALVALAFNHVAAGLGADMLEVRFAVFMRLVRGILPAVPTTTAPRHAATTARIATARASAGKASAVAMAGVLIG